MEFESKPGFVEWQKRKMFSRWVVYACLGALAGVNGPATAQATGDYAEDLARVYGAHQHLLATRDACDEAFPAWRAGTDKAYSEWSRDYKSLLEELDSRVTLMIRNASTDQRDYSRNLGKYKGAILQRRLEFKRSLLALHTTELEQRCRQFPAYLKGPESDFRKKYAGELKTIRARK